MRERPRVCLFECVWPVTLGIGQNIDKVTYSVSGGRNIYLQISRLHGGSLFPFFPYNIGVAFTVKEVGK